MHVLLVLGFNLFNSSIYLVNLINLNFWHINFFINTLLFSLLFNILKFTYFKYFLFTLVYLYSSTSYYLNLNALYLNLQNPLWVGTILCHPPLFYICLIFFFNFFLNYRFEKYTYFVISISKHAYLLFLTLVLGSMWSTQSVTWGYIWVNDSIEWLLLCIYLFMLDDG